VSLTAATARQAARAIVKDGLSADATPVPYRLARLEDLSDQIAPAATPTQTQFVIRFEQVPTQGLATAYAIAGTLVAYVDGSSTPTRPSVDVDQNGGFTLPAAPTKALQVTYGWQYLLDSDVDGYVDRARAWLRAPSVDQLADGLGGALTKYAAALACEALASMLNLATARAGSEEISFSDLAKAYQQQAKQLRAEATQERNDFSQSPERLSPAVDAAALRIDPYQPRR
jgi:hypothetical protein